MQIVINTFGAFIGKREDCFIVKIDNEYKLISARKVSSILITTHASFSTDVIELALKYNIDILFLNKYGDPIGRIWHPKLGSTTTIRRRQLEIADGEEGLKLAVEWVLRKIDNQVKFLGELKRHREAKREKLEEYIVRLETIKETMSILTGTIEEKRQTIMGLEGSAGRTYFEAISYIMPERFKFKGRSRQPAVDEFNCLLNYCYGILYSIVEKACIIAGLDPFVGFIHTDNYNKKSLVFDLIEQYRIIAERTVLNLFSKKVVKNEFFDKIRNGLTLNKSGKEKIITAFNERLDTKVRYKGRNITERDIIQFDCHRIAQRLIGR
ncbi:CRISPR-associated endonuclease Cas1 [candidate division KSB1 bacterium]|nr:MAG: CRISPR-associated endonuclease Cas1 [candidate division KSB1 bacterium]